MDTITEQVDEKIRLIEDLTLQHNNTPPEENYEDYLIRDNNFNIQINNIKLEIVELLKLSPLYKRLFQLKALNLI